jgi:hypothetical protein
MVRTGMVQERWRNLKTVEAEPSARVGASPLEAYRFGRFGTPNAGCDTRPRSCIRSMESRSVPLVGACRLFIWSLDCADRLPVATGLDRFRAE